MGKANKIYYFPVTKKFLLIRTLKNQAIVSPSIRSIWVVHFIFFWKMSMNVSMLTVNMLVYVYVYAGGGNQTEDHLITPLLCSPFI